MKLHELYQLDTQPEALEEGAITRAIAAATLAVSSLIPGSLDKASLPSTVTAMQQQRDRSGVDAELLISKTAELAAAKYKVDPELVRQIAAAAVKHQYSDFPRAVDILAVVTVESNFNPNAKSKLKKDPAVGLTQIRPKVWGLAKEDLSTVEQQVAQGAKILRKYYERFGSREAALHAYNVGPTNHLRSAKQPVRGNPRYVPKVNAARDWIDSAVTNKQHNVKQLSDTQKNAARET